MGNPLKIYTVCDPMSGDILAQGSAEQCAEILGVTEKSFYTLRHWSNNGHGKYHIEAVEIHERDVENIIKLWDDSFSWLREREVTANPYPCDRCMRRSICEYQDTYCDKWEHWYQIEHERVSELLHQEARRIVET